jgi:hypothetical protein
MWIGWIRLGKARQAEPFVDFCHDSLDQHYGSEVIAALILVAVHGQLCGEYFRRNVQSVDAKNRQGRNHQS